ncbi:DNA topoisomerase 1 [Chytridiales sp. JEL 0842]|nr:DNA topoisomerase 1 [Chytridiales sp. JEL 0842]
MDSSDDDAPLSTRVSNGKVKSEGKTPEVKKEDDDSDSDVPLAQKTVIKAEPVNDGGLRSHVPHSRSLTSLLATATANGKRKPKGTANGSVQAKKVKKEADNEKPVAVKTESKKRKAEDKKEEDDSQALKKKKKKKVKEEEEEEKKSEEEEEEYQWWKDNQLNDGAEKWTQLEHCGPLFPPPYEPHGIKMKYNGVPVDLEPEAEEVATFFAALLGTDYASNETFVTNFFNDFLKPSPIKEFKKCDFTPIHEYLNEQKELKKNKTKEEKQAIKEEKKKIDDVYGWAILDGRKEKVGNFRIEPPGLFRGRGNHPKTGTLKLRVVPEQVTINIGKGAKIPEPPAGHQWANVLHDNTVTWLAMWKENVNDSIKYVFLAATSSLKGQSDLKKFEKARGLKEKVAMIRKDYTEGWKDKLMATRQRDTAMYLIDRFALRAGNEKGDDEADTVGCCSLRYEHITLEPPNKVIFDFLGKDSIRYYNEVLVEEQVFKNLRLFKKDKKDGDLLFDRLSTNILNKHLSTYMQGLTAKVFRTFNASFTFQQELEKTPANGSVQEKILAYNRANRQVAILCNHQRSVSKGHSSQIGKILDKVRGFKYERMQVKKQILDQNPKLKKTKPEYAEEESDVDDEFIERYLEMTAEKEKEKMAKSLEKENEKRAAEGLAPLKELPAKKKTTGQLPLDKLEKKYEDLSKKIETTKLQMIDKDENKTTALSTSKINYIDPRISISWCKKWGVDVEKIFNRTLREKFKWALDVEKEWTF